MELTICGFLVDGATALHWACRYSNDEALEILLQYGADVTLGDAFGRLPIHWAAVNSDVKCLQVCVNILFKYAFILVLLYC